MTLAPDSLGPTLCVGEILAEIVATTVGGGFAEPIPLIGPYPSGAPAIFVVQCGRIGGTAAMIGTVGDEEQAIKRLFADGISEIAIKRGAQESTTYEPDGIVTHVPAFAVKKIDPTGAGDRFDGANVATRRVGMSVKQALIYANAAGARNVTIRGPMEGAGTRDELDAFIAASERRA